MDTQCPAFIFCKFLEGYWTVVRGNVHHNHECNSLRYDCNTWMRRLTAAELETVKPLLISGTSAFNVIHYAYQSYGKRLTAQDVFNMRYKVFLCRVHLLRNVIKRVSFPFFTNNPFIVFVEATI